MATYFVWSGGNNTTGADWTNAKTTLAGGLALATSAGDVVKVHVGHAEAVGSATTWTFAQSVSVICVDKDNSDALATQNGTTQYLGHTTTAYTLTFAGAYKCYIYGLAFIIASNNARNITCASTVGQQMVMDSCKLWLNTGTTGLFLTGGTGGASVEMHTRLINCDIKTGAAANYIHLYGGGRAELISCTLNAAGTAPTVTFLDAAAGNSGSVVCEGCDLSLSSTLVGDNASGGTVTYVFRQCKLKTSVTVLASQTSFPNQSGTEVYLHDCSIGSAADEHFHFGYYNALGSVIIDTGIYANDGAIYTGTTRHSWKIVGTANATFYAPFRTPWINVYHEGTSAITPNLECVRSGSATAYQNDVLWTEWMYKGTSGSTRGTFDQTDRMAILGSAADQTTGALAAGDWTGENATSWFGKLAPASAITPAEIGDICVRVCVAGANTVYVDPQIRSLS